MNDPERWSVSPDAPNSMREMLSAAQKVGPTTVERAALAGKLGVATSGLWIVPALKGLAGVAFVAGGVWIATAGDPVPSSRSEVNSVASTSALPSPELAERAAPAVESAPQVVPEADVEKQDAEVPVETNVGDIGPTKRKVPAGASKPTEISMIAAAKKSLESAPQKALSLLSEHARVYPSGVLAEEREVLRIRALKNLGREKDAKAQQQKFHQEHPESVHHVP